VKGEIVVPVLGGLASVLVSFHDESVTIAIVIGAARVEGRISRESWGRIVRGDVAP